MRPLCVTFTKLIFSEEEGQKLYCTFSRLISFFQCSTDFLYVLAWGYKLSYYVVRQLFVCAFIWNRRMRRSGGRFIRFARGSFISTLYQASQRINVYGWQLKLITCGIERRWCFFYKRFWRVVKCAVELLKQKNQQTNVLQKKNITEVQYWSQSR